MTFIATNNLINLNNCMFAQLCYLQVMQVQALQVVLAKYTLHAIVMAEMCLSIQVGIFA